MTSFPREETRTVRKAFQNKENIQKNCRVLEVKRKQFHHEGNYHKRDAEESSDTYFKKVPTSIWIKHHLRKNEDIYKNSQN